MFNKDFYPTPDSIINLMLEGENIQGLTILEPSAGKGNIVDYLNSRGAKNILVCEKNQDLAEIVKAKGTFLKYDFFDVESSDISHIDLIVMNPPFSNADKHILHAFEIAPSGCTIISLCNIDTLENDWTTTRKELKKIVELNGNFRNLENAFSDAERKTEVHTALIRVQKPTDDYKAEFDGFYMEEDEEEAQENALMSYNVIRDLVGRYIESIKIFDKQLEEAQKMNSLTSGYFGVNIGMSISNNEKPIKRAEFKKAMQKSGWNFIIRKMNMEKYSTRALKDDLNKFVEQQQQIPFTMRNIYKMLEIIIGTTGSRMDKAILEAFDSITKHYSENRYNLEGWKTNSHYLVNEKFIFPHMVDDYKWSWNKYKVSPSSSSNFEKIEDLVKAICFITGDDYTQKTSLYSYLNEKKCDYGTWYDWEFFQVKGFKKGTMHFQFKDREIWAKFNQRVAKLKGYPLFESTEQARKKNTPKNKPNGKEIKKEPVILKTYTLF